MRYKIRFSFDGSNFCGWQAQTNATSVQECLQKSLSTLLNERISIVGAGRTDSKVNAVNYIAHFDYIGEADLVTEAFRYKINAITPLSIEVHEVSAVPEDFHARFDASKREYAYFLHRRKDPFMNSYSYLYTYSLDIELMNEAAANLVGTHDFSCFEKTGGSNKTSICTVSKAIWKPFVPSHVSLLGYEASPQDYLMFRISADRFLRNMVRAVVGSLLEVGRGKRSPEWIASLIESGSRSDAGESVPGNALFLFDVEYPDAESQK